MYKWEETRSKRLQFLSDSIASLPIIICVFILYNPALFQAFHLHLCGHMKGRIGHVGLMLPVWSTTRMGHKTRHHPLSFWWLLSPLSSLVVPYAPTLLLPSSYSISDHTTAWSIGGPWCLIIRTTRSHCGASSFHWSLHLYHLIYLLIYIMSLSPPYTDLFH